MYCHYSPAVYCIHLGNVTIFCRFWLCYLVFDLDAMYMYIQCVSDGCSIASWLSWRFEKELELENSIVEKHYKFNATYTEVHAAVQHEMYCM